MKGRLASPWRGSITSGTCRPRIRATPERASQGLRRVSETGGLGHMGVALGVAEAEDARCSSVGRQRWLRKWITPRRQGAHRSPLLLRPSLAVRGQSLARPRPHCGPQRGIVSCGDEGGRLAKPDDDGRPARSREEVALDAE